VQPPTVPNPPLSPTAPSVAGASDRTPFDQFDDAEVSPLRRRAMLMIALGEFLDGYDLIAIAGALLQLKGQFALTAGQIGLLGGSAYIGAALGLLGAGAIADRIGRRAIFVHNFWLFAVLAVVSAFITGFYPLLAIRFLLGIAIGADIAISIPFLAEIAPRRSRGRWAGAVPQVAWTLGAITSLALAMLLIHVAGEHAWRWLFGLGAIPALIILAGRHGVPESPHWLLSHGRVAEAHEAMRTFGMPIDAARTRASVAAGAAGMRSTGSFLDIFRAPYTARAWVVMIVLGVGPLVGSAAAVVSPYILNIVGLIGPTASLTGSILIWVGGLVGAIVAFFTVDRLGRMRSSALAMWGNAACLLLLIVTMGQPVLFVAIYVLYGLFVWFGSSSNWLLPSELLPAHLRARAQGVGSGLSRLSAGVVTALIPMGIERWGFAPTFGLLGAIGIALGLFILANRRFEAMGKALEL
jgi:putative MFS transporter